MPPPQKSPGAYPGHLYHKTPGWVADGGLFHIRIRAANRRATDLTEPKMAENLLSWARQYHEIGTWWCDLFLVMPDHLHALLAFPRESGMSKAVRSWKGYATRFLGASWQENYFDRRMRTEKEASEKWWYIRNNPVAIGLCANVDNWPWWWGGAAGRVVASREDGPL